MSQKGIVFNNKEIRDMIIQEAVIITGEKHEDMTVHVSVYDNSITAVVVHVDPQKDISDP